MHYWRDGHDMCRCGANHRRKFVLMQKTAKYMRKAPGPNQWNDLKLYKNEPTVFKKAPKRRKDAVPDDSI